jgi:hypothetical protein
MTILKYLTVYNEFSARIAYVDFNGREVLGASGVLFNEEKDHYEFEETYCPKVVSTV